MDTHELVPMTRRRYRTLVLAAEDAARTTTPSRPAPPTAPLPGPTPVSAVPGLSAVASHPTVVALPTRRRPAPVVPLPRSRRRASLRLTGAPAS